MSGVLVAGVGNIFLGDDAFGVELAGRLAEEELPAGSRVEDFGIRGMHLALELLNGYDALVLLDAMALGEEPGTITVLEVDADTVETGNPADPQRPSLNAHGMSPDAVLAMLAELGGDVSTVVVIGCEPAEITEQMGLSAPVQAAVERAVATTLDVVASLAGAGAGTTDSTAPTKEAAR